MNFFTFISHVVSLQSKQPLFFPGVYSKTFMAIQQSVQKLWPFSTVILVWSDKTSNSSSRDSIGNTRKTPPETSVKL